MILVCWWHRIGEQIALFLNNIDWYGLITSAAKALRAALIAFIVMVQEFIKTLEWHKIAEQIYTAINDSTGNETLFKNLGKTLSNLFIHIFDFIREVIAGIEWEQIGRDIAAFLIGIDWVGLVNSVLDVMETAFDAIIDFIIGFFKELGEELDISQIIDPIGDRRAGIWPCVLQVRDSGAAARRRSADGGANMSKFVFTVDGIEYSKIHVVSLKRSFSVLDGENAGRTMDGAMQRDIIGTYYNYALEPQRRPS